MYLFHPLIVRASSVLGFAFMACASNAQSHLPPPSAEGQVQILNADRWDYDSKLGKGAQRLIGNVRFQHMDAVMHCDSAYLYDDNTVEAFSRVGIQQNDTLNIIGDHLSYSGKQRLALITGNVQLRDPGMELTTDALTYDLAQHAARYSSGARIVSSRDNNTLTSTHGAYLTAERKFIFSGNVLIEHPDRTIRADTLHYTTSSGVAEFFGPTHITQAKTYMYCERGSYDTRTEQGLFTRAGRILNGGQTLVGDSLHYDRATGEGLGWGHVAVIDTAAHLVVRGAIGKHSEKEARSMITGHAELVMLMGADSLFLHADTLFATTDSTRGRVIKAWRSVRFFKSDLQGICDTMVYVDRDSLITLYGAPFLWSGKNQINGHTVSITLHDGHAHHLLAVGDAFLSSVADTTHFDQVTGTTITGFFANDQLSHLVAEGNSRTVYFAREKKDGVERLTGVNRADCSRIVVQLDSGRVSTVNFLTQPDAVLYPLAKAPPEELRMKGFLWNAYLRPVEHGDIFSVPIAPPAQMEEMK